MTRLASARTLLGLAFALGFSAATVVAAQDVAFYEAQLREGHQAVRARQFPSAIDHYRIAAFGFLNRPDRLSEALVRLALAQRDAGRSDELGATLERFLEVERGFSAFEAAGLDNPTRSAFRRILEGKVPAQTLAAIPSLSGRGARPSVAAGAETGAPASAQIPADGGNANGPAATNASPPIENASPPPAVANVAETQPESRAAGAEITPESEVVDEPPRYRTTVKPRYPLIALRNRIGGIVLLRVLVSETGKPVQIEILRQVHPELSAAAVGAVRRWEFEPARRNGIAVAAWTTIPIPFRP